MPRARTSRSRTWLTGLAVGTAVLAAPAAASPQGFAPQVKGVVQQVKGDGHGKGAQPPRKGAEPPAKGADPQVAPAVQQVPSPAPQVPSAAPQGKDSAPHGKDSAPHGKGAAPEGRGAVRQGKGSATQGEGSGRQGSAAAGHVKGAVGQVDGAVKQIEGALQRKSSTGPVTVPAPSPPADPVGGLLQQVSDVVKQVVPPADSTPRQPAPAPAATTPSPASSGAISDAARRSQSGTSASRASASAPGAAGTPSVSLPTEGSATPRRAAPQRPQGAIGHSLAKKSSPSVVSRTVTRVIGVVPRPIRIAIAALVALALLLAAATGVMGRRARRVERQRRLLAADVGLLQSAVLPVLPDEVGAASVSAAYRPAEGLAAGGDFYDAFPLPDGRTCLLVGDVAGHGRESVPLTAHVRYTLRAYLEAGVSPRIALQVAAGVVGPRLGEGTVTVVAAVYDPASGDLTYACAGHAPPLLAGVRADPIVACSSPPFAAGVTTGRRQTTVPLPPGTMACFYTDGLADVCVGAERLGPERLAQELRAAGPGVTATELIERVVKRSDEQPDDMAACIVRPLATGAAGDGQRVEELELNDRLLDRGWGERFLAACDVGPEATETAMKQVREAVEQTGTAVLCVKGGGVTVSRRELVALPDQQGQLAVA